VVWAVLLGPLITLLIRSSPGRIQAALRAPGALGPLETSLASAGIALAALVVLGTPLGWVLARSKRRGVRILELGVLAMLLMPPLVVGLVLVFMLGPLTPLGGLLGRVHLSATNTFLALVIAEIYEAAPYFVLGAQAAFASVDDGLLEQASLLGDSSWRRFKRVALPLAAAGLTESLTLAWARAMGAFGAVIIIAYHPYGLPMQIWTTLNEVGLAQALPFALALVVVALPFPLLAYAWARHARG
jgi:molybdate/tungstate transport system permease protein